MSSNRSEGVVLDEIIANIEERSFGFCLHARGGEEPNWGGVSWGWDPFLVITAYGNRVTCWEKEDVLTLEGDPLSVLGGWLDRYSGASGGAVGFLSYELWTHLGWGIESNRTFSEFPTLFVAFYEKIHTAALDPSPPPPLRGGIDKGSLPSLEPFSDLSRERYLRAVERIQKYIAAGDIYQANLTQRFTIPSAVSLSGAFLEISRGHPVPYGAYLCTPEFEIVSNSPECFLKYDPRSRVVETWPVKGTRPRGKEREEDARLRQELIDSPKDRAENLMIVDLERNDLGRVCETGSVEVPRLCEIQTLGTVHHLVSQVRGLCREDCDRIDILRASFPGGSVTGVPKLRAMQILNSLEPTPREVYTGAIGYFGFDGSLHLNMPIRTAWRFQGRLHYASGGGIVADSDPEKEYEESLLKASILHWIAPSLRSSPPKGGGD